ncbi:T9SS type A sorting domain-containing protein [bacterium]|nr:T9SS type A sorting domain-containing protein [bacterium]MBU1983625.1 T9SS type A sorting domain-containing protein [bacterium]
MILRRTAGRFLWALIVILFGAGAATADCLDTCYYTRAELEEFILQLEVNDSLNMVHVEIIGHSRGQQLGEVYPIYAVKISDNADQFEDEPTVLIIGHIHAEEVIGLQLTTSFMKDLIRRRNYYSALIAGTQLYFIPTMNPDGLEMVSRSIDCYSRKNGYYPPELGGRECNIHSGPGADSCGVDPNRNFGINWIYGDTLWQPFSTPMFDYYRGPAPFSEPEAQAVAAFAERIKPTVSIVYHSSRQGTVAEQGIVAWQWPGSETGPNKFPPDCTSIGWINRRYCAQLPKAGASGYYQEVWGGTHNGCTQDWFYWKLGTIQVVTELGPPISIQPSCSTSSELIPDIFSLVRADMKSLYWMCRRPINYNLPDETEGMTPLRIYTRNSVTGSPISAEYRNLNTWTALLPPRYTNEEFGRATILPIPGTVRIMARKEGYVPDTVTVAVNPNSSPRDVFVNLQPLPWYVLTLQLKDTGGNGIAGRIFLDYDYPKWVDVPAEGTTVSLPEGNYRLMGMADAAIGLVPLWREFWLGGDATVELYLPIAQPVWVEDFENGLDGWMAGGQGSSWRLDADTSTAMNFGTSLSTNPPGYRAVYQNNADTWIQYNSTIQCTDGNVCYLEFYRRGRLDVPTDSFLVEISTDGIVWEQAAGYCDMELPWTRTFVDLAPWTPGTLNLRFRLKSDAVLGDLGIHVDQVRVFTGTDLDAPPPPPAVAYEYRITGAYPNPFNPATTITYEVAQPGPLTLTVYNVLGKEVRRFEMNARAAGPQRLIWDGTARSGESVASGLYFIRMESPVLRAPHKLLLLR